MKLNWVNVGSLLQAAPGAKRRESHLGKQKTHIFTTNTDAAPLPGHRLSRSQSHQRSHRGAHKARKGENGGGWGGWGGCGGSGGGSVSSNLRVQARWLRVHTHAVFATIALLWLHILFLVKIIYASAKNFSSLATERCPSFSPHVPLLLLPVLLHSSPTGTAFLRTSEATAAHLTASPSTPMRVSSPVQTPARPPSNATALENQSILSPSAIT